VSTVKPLTFSIVLWLIFSASFLLANNRRNTSNAYSKIELAYDTNVFEQRRGSTTDPNIQVWGGYAFTLQPRKGRFHLDYTGNLTLYRSCYTDDKLYQALQTIGLWQLSQRWSLRPEFGLVWKYWLADQTGYNNLSATLALQYQSPRLVLIFGSVNGRYDYPIRPNFDHYLTGLSVHLLRPIGPSWSASLKTQSHQIRYRHRSIFQPVDLQTSPTIRQHDILWHFDGGIDYRRDYIFGLHLLFISSRSNSLFSAYYSGVARIQFAGCLGRIMIHAIGQAQMKHYREDLRSHLIYTDNPDPEQNTQNQVFLGWEYPLNRELSLTGKLISIYNETRLSGLYYTKNWISCGLQYDF